MSQVLRGPAGSFRLERPERDRLPPHLRPSADAAPCPLCPAPSGGAEQLRCIASVGEAEALVPPRPMLRVEEVLHRRGDGYGSRTSATGAHELIREGHGHQPSLHRRGVDSVADVLDLVARRIADLHHDHRLRSLGWSRDQRRASGGIAHGHGHLVGLPELPPRVAARVEAERAWWRRFERPLRGDERDRALADDRVVVDTGDVVAWVPEDGGDFELRLASRSPLACFGQSSRAQHEAFARALCLASEALDRVLGEPPTALWLETAPAPSWRQARAPELASASLACFVVQPQLSARAAWELATGAVEGHVPAGRAAAELRAACSPDRGT